jgi:hypothetical protein
VRVRQSKHVSADGIINQRRNAKANQPFDEDAESDPKSEGNPALAEERSIAAFHDLHLRWNNNRPQFHRREPSFVGAGKDWPAGRAHQELAGSRRTTPH